MVHCCLLGWPLHHLWNTFLFRIRHLSPEACRASDRLWNLPNLGLNCQVFLKHRAAVHHHENYWSRWTYNRKSHFWNPANYGWISASRDDHFLRLQRGFRELWYLDIHSYSFAMRRHGIWFLCGYNWLQFNLWWIVLLPFRVLRCQLCAKHLHGYRWRQLHPSKIQKELLMAARRWGKRTRARRIPWII